MAERRTGSVKWFNNARGYGFINSDNQEDDIFVHYRNIQGDGYRSLREGQRVEFDLTQGDKGFQAENVERLELETA